MKYHLVLFRLKSEAPVGEADRIFEQINSLQGRVPGIVSIESLVIEKSEGENNYSHGFNVSFANEAGKNDFFNNSLPSEVARGLYEFVEDSLILSMNRTYASYKTRSIPPKIIQKQISAKTL